MKCVEDTGGRRVSYLENPEMRVRLLSGSSESEENRAFFDALSVYLSSIKSSVVFSLMLGARHRLNVSNTFNAAPSSRNPNSIQFQFYDYLMLIECRDERGESKREMLDRSEQNPEIHRRLSGRRVSAAVRRRDAKRRGILNHYQS